MRKIDVCVMFIRVDVEEMHDLEKVHHGKMEMYVCIVYL